MSRRSRPSIPYELHKKKAQEIYKKRVTNGNNGSHKDDWQMAKIFLDNNPKIVRDWKRGQMIAFYRQLPKSFFRRLWLSLKALIIVIGKIIIFPLWLFYKLPQLFANTDTRPFALDVVKTIISAASLIAAVIAAIGLFVNYQDAREDRWLTQERLVTDRFAKAVEQIGSKEEEEVVIGGIYSLERIAKDSPKDQWTIMEVLTAFVRKNSPIPAETKKLEERSEEKLKALEKLDPVDIQIQAALTVIGRRDGKRDYTSDEGPEANTKRLDLSNSNLIGADLSGADLSSADLSRAILYRADLSGADLDSANLDRADLSRAILYRADLSGADLDSANLDRAILDSADLRSAFLDRAILDRAILDRAILSSADLDSADLSSAYLGGADLRSAYLGGANLSSANLGGANLSRAYLSRADLSRADLIGANLRSAYLIRADLSRADLSRADLSRAYLIGANLGGADLRSAKNLSNSQIKSACFWEEAIYTDLEWNILEQNLMVLDEKANQNRINRIEAIKQDKASDPENSPDCSIWE